MEILNTVNLSQHWLMVLFYSDYSALNEGEESLINEWVEEYPDVTFNVLDDSETFTKDDISGLYADCVEVEIIKF